MDLRDPTRALTPTLDGPVLSVLARSGRPLTVGQIAEQAARGSEIGIRRSVARLVEQGLVTATQMGRNQVHELNRQHVAAPAAVVLADLRLELWKRFRSAVAEWVEEPKYACVFGSAARGDGGTDSDIDLLLVHRPFPGDEPPKLEAPRPHWALAALGTLLSPTTFPNPDGRPDVTAWQSQVDDLHGTVQRWTGNPLHVVELSTWQWTGLSATNPELHREIQRDGITVAGNANVWAF